MAPTIRNGDALLVDVGVNAVDSDAIYYFEMGGRLHVKRIQRNLDGLTIISDNTQYREISVPADRESDIRILAQIIYWWTGRSF
ncbi:putative HTH-type transcriptional regulator [compost metagenome]